MGLLLLLAVMPLPCPAQIHHLDRPGSIEVRVGDRAAWTYVYRDATLPRPYFSQVYAPNGTLATRHHPPRPEVDSVDHPTFHPGIWMAFGDINGADSWRLKSGIEHVCFLAPPSTTERGSFTFAVRDRILDSGQPAGIVADMDSRFEFLLLTDAYLLLWDVTISSSQSLRFGDQEEMGLGFRVATPLRVEQTTKNQPELAAGLGQIRNSEGKQNEAEVWGKPAAWCDYSGILGQSRVGMALLCHPSNRRPTRFHVRDRGYAVANLFATRAFGDAESRPIVLPPGETLRLRYGVLIYAIAASHLESSGKDSTVTSPAAGVLLDDKFLDKAYQRYLELSDG